jgi:hypothetical protein
MAVRIHCLKEDASAGNLGLDGAAETERANVALAGRRRRFGREARQVGRALDPGRRLRDLLASAAADADDVLAREASLVALCGGGRRIRQQVARKGTKV